MVYVCVCMCVCVACGQCQGCERAF
uniref:Uncharacterized protein n=1 Tax=Anguilla anguilla TaxID=7936 RepID=A0A0E9RU15_ANGAN